MCVLIVPNVKHMTNKGCRMMACYSKIILNKWHGDEVVCINTAFWCHSWLEPFYVEILSVCKIKCIKRKAENLLLHFSHLIFLSFSFIHFHFSHFQQPLHLSIAMKKKKKISGDVLSNITSLMCVCCFLPFYIFHHRILVLVITLLSDKALISPVEKSHNRSEILWPV